jgi:hypothetical protein
MDPLLDSRDSAAFLGISVTTLYDWLRQSDEGTFELRGQATTINYYQGGRHGQGRIKIEPSEIERLQQLMRVHPRPQKKPRQLIKLQQFPGITVPLGRPD